MLLLRLTYSIDSKRKASSDLPSGKKLALTENTSKRKGSREDLMCFPAICILGVLTESLLGLL